MATSKFRSAEFITAVTDFGTIGTVGAGGVRGFSLNLTPVDGYQPVGILQINKGGPSSGHCMPTSYYISANTNTLNIDVKNAASGTATISLLVVALYKKI